MCKFCDKNEVIQPNEGPQLEFGLSSGKFGDIIKLSINSYRREMSVLIDNFPHPLITDHLCMMYNTGFIKPHCELRYAVYKINYCPFCGKKLENGK